jgi:hypothetical protein
MSRKLLDGPGFATFCTVPGRPCRLVQPIAIRRSISSLTAKGQQPACPRLGITRIQATSNQM